MSETKEYREKVYRKVPDANYYRCNKCCFWSGEDSCKCNAPDVFFGCHSEFFYWEEVKGEKR